MTAEGDNRVLIAEARVARQRELIARIEARGGDISEAKSLLSVLEYSLRLLSSVSAGRSGAAPTGVEGTHGIGSE